MSFDRKIDSIDASIIELLQRDGRLSNTDIARELDVSEATVRGRIKRLIDDEVIQIVAVSNPLRLGFEITGDLYITVDMKKMDNVIAKLKNFKELWYIVTTTGRFNLNAEFVVKDLESLNDLVYNKLSHIDGILQIETSIIMKYIKRKYDFGTPA
ncbi:MAG TPA: Lrp/AsnC family transcriptional regulator [Spirochaetota bacterium]|jgi:Lrp/AsnC family transcriptional regulator for asnA, asnC and gidA|nr:Lrp/AsnC family transcriptional regulator [Spirochaetota bacterium]HON16638.1 Lrp/AsnC family transcriptional regulator [Spirochaetota bacterium]HPD79048.1 Lrp/AsnC family transcriptional regulator [Spirochaetota bacterium]HPP96103.1 Lrp/AsnC family transcriptional regulator [Spirochaetota bacterium]HRU66391.1 Lrp/AsnC family transcriptional regulator [Spirochaetota bacterium]